MIFDLSILSFVDVHFDHYQSIRFSGTVDHAFIQQTFIECPLCAGTLLGTEDPQQTEETKIPVWGEAGNQTIIETYRIYICKGQASLSQLLSLLS